MHGQSTEFVARLALLLTLVLGALSGCGNIPRPFEPSAETVIPLPETPSTLGVGILPVSGLDSAQTVEMAEKIAEALRVSGIPAQAVNRAGQLGFTLEGTLNGATQSPDDASLRAVWRLTKRDNALVEEIEQVFPRGLRDRQTITPELETEIAQSIAAHIGSLWAPTIAVPQDQGLPGDGLTVTIQPPVSAPGDGNAALVRVLANRLIRLGFAPAVDNPSFVLAGTVTLKTYDSVQDDISVVWKVLDGNGDGVELGEVRLDNRIPRGDLDGAWGLIAEAIIDSALPGLVKIMVAAAPTRNPASARNK